MNEMKPQKQVVIEKALNLDYMLLLLSVLVFTNMSLIIFIRKPITQLSISIVLKNIPIGMMFVTFTAFSFLVAFIYPKLYRLLWHLLFPIMWRLKYFVGGKLSNNDMSYHTDWKHISLVEFLAIKTNNSVLMNYCTKNISEDEKLERTAFLSFSFLLSLLLDTIICFKYDVVSSSFAYIVSSFGGQFSEEIARLINFVMIIFIVFLFFYSFYPKNNIRRVYIPKEIWESLETKYANKSLQATPNSGVPEL